jgi:hypothetical protein
MIQSVAAINKKQPKDTSETAISKSDLVSIYKEFGFHINFDLEAAGKSIR